MRIRHNLQSMNAYRNYGQSVSMLSKHMERLSSGYRVNRAGDDAAGLAISEKMRFQITGLNQGIKNAKDGISLCQTAEGALEEVHGMLRRMKELTIEAANGTYSEMERNEIQKEIDQILTEIDRISEASNFNGRTLFVEDKALDGVGNVEDIPDLPEVVPGGATVQCGDFLVTGGEEGVDYSFENGLLTIKTNTALRITTNGVKTTDRIEVARNVDANITLAGVNIDTSETDRTAAFRIADNSTGNVNIMLEGNNYLSSGYVCAGLQKDGANANVGTLTIRGTGSLTARGGYSASGIGGGGTGTSSAANIVIESGIINAYGGAGGAGIGSGNGQSIRNIRITGGTINAYGGDGISGTVGGGAGIGGGADNAVADTIIIEGGTINAYGGNIGGAGIGGGGKASNIKITGGVIRATGGGGVNSGGAGIGSGKRQDATNIEILGGTVTATGGAHAAGIGAGYSGSANTIKISDAVVTATAGSTTNGHGGAGIGGGAYGNGTTIEITNATVRATGSGYGAGIGGGTGGDSNGVRRGYGSGIKINNSVVDAWAGQITDTQPGGQAIGGGNGCYGENPTIGDSLVLEWRKGVHTGKVYGDATVRDDFEIGSGVTVEIEENASLTVEEGATLTNRGTIHNNGVIHNGGTIYNSGTITGDGSMTGKSVIEVSKDPVGGSGVRDDELPEPVEGTIKRIWIQCGFDPKDGIYVEIAGMDTAILGIRGITVSTVARAGKALDRVVWAVNKVSDIRGTIGAQQNRLEHTINHQMNTVENLTNAESVIRDTDVAEEMMGLIKVQILTQSGMSMLSRANMSAQGVLSLLQ